MELATQTPAQAVAQIKHALRTGGPNPAFTLILGAGFSHGLVPLTRQMMEEEIGAWMAGDHGELSVDGKREMSAEFWRDFNAANERENTGCCVELDERGLPRDPTVAYQRVSRSNAQGGIGTIEQARDFLRAMVESSADRLNGAHFFLAAILDAQRRGKLFGRRPFCRTIFTTNFDTLLQRSLQLVNVLYYMTDRPELRVNSGHMVEDDDAVHLVYTHGSVLRPYLANSEPELRALCEMNAPAFQPLMEQRGVIVIGYSGWDDSVMAALRACRGFASNLYWCDMFPATAALDRLTPPARELLTNAGGRGFYVPLDPAGADDFMGRLYQALVPDEGIPRMLLNPFSVLEESLKRLSLPKVMLKDYAASAQTNPQKALELEKEAQALLANALTKVEHARKLTEQTPSAGSEPSAEDNAETETGIAQHLNNMAFERALAGQIDRAIDLWSAVTELPNAPPEEVVQALLNRAVMYGEQNDAEKAFADYSRAIELPGAPPDQVAKALYNRGVAYGEQNDADNEIADYSRAIELPGARPDHVAMALFNRGVTYSQQNNSEKAIADYSRVIELSGAPPDQVAKALVNRGVAYGDQNDPEKAIADYSRAIELPGAPPDQIAKALFNRGVTYSRQNNPEKEIADYSRAIELPGAPPDQVVRALFNRGLTYGRQNDAEKELADYSRAVELPGAPPDQVALALVYRGLAYSQQNDPDKEIADYSRAIELPGAPPEQIAKALVYRGLTYHHQQNNPEKAIADYSRAIELSDAPPDQVAQALVNRGIKARPKRPSPTFRARSSFRARRPTRSPTRSRVAAGCTTNDAMRSDFSRTPLRQPRPTPRPTTAAISAWRSSSRQTMARQSRSTDGWLPRSGPPTRSRAFARTSRRR